MVDGCSVWAEPTIKRAHSWQFLEPGERPQGAQIGSSLGRIVVVSCFQAALAGLHGKQIGASGFGRGSNKQGGGQRNRGGQINKGGSRKQGGCQINSGEGFK